MNERLKTLGRSVVAGFDLMPYIVCGYGTARLYLVVTNWQPCSANRGDASGAAKELSMLFMLILAGATGTAFCLLDSTLYGFELGRAIHGYFAAASAVLGAYGGLAFAVGWRNAWAALKSRIRRA